MDKIKKILKQIWGYKLYVNLKRKYIPSFFCFLFSKLPIHNRKVVVDNFDGLGYGDNPKYIVEEIYKQELDYKIIWLLRNNVNCNNIPKKVKTVKFNSVRALYHLATAEFWIDNVRKTHPTIKRYRQKYIQTWHGAYGLKKVEKDVEDKLSNDYVKYAKLDSKNCDLFISNSKGMSNLYRNAFWYDGEILEVGFPRNDIFFKSDICLDEKVREYFKLSKEKKIALYAPTFRSNNSIDVYDLDYNKCLKSLEKRYGGEWIFLIRLHPNIAKDSDKINYDNNKLFNASFYDDMQELLAISDCLITDYSSSPYDFILTRKPCFLYIPDLLEYMADRDFYIPMEENIFLKAMSNDDLCNLIESFDEIQYQCMINNFLDENEIMDKGNASKEIVTWMERSKNKK